MRASQSASARLKHVQSDPESAPGALAPRPADAPLAETNATLTGGAGLFDHSARDPFPRSVGLWTGVVGLVLTVAITAVFVSLNPALESGKAGGTPNQL